MNLQTDEFQKAAFHASLPKITWERKHDLPGILNRLGHDGVFVEVGVGRGSFSRWFRENWGGKLHVCVDKWEPHDNQPGVSRETLLQMRDEAHANLKSALKPVEIINKWSVEAAHDIAARDDANQIKRLWNGGLDGVYLDGDCSYPSMQGSLAAWLPLIKPGGVICGGGYVVDGWHRRKDGFTAYDTLEFTGTPDAKPFGVRRAVHERWPESDVSVTSDDFDDGFRSWLVQL